MSSSPLRAPTGADAEQIAALFRAAYPVWRPLTADDVLAWLRDPEVGEENIRVLEVDERVVGYGDLTFGRDVQLDVAAPGHWDVFLDWLEERARGSRARAYFPQGHELEAVVGARGYRYWRSSLTMEIDLPARTTAARVPEGIDVRAYREEDAGAVAAAVNEAFVADPFWQDVDPESFHTVYAGSRHADPALWRVAWDGGEVAGCVLPDPSRGADTSLGWVRILAVREPWRRRGLGEALLRRALHEHYDRGLHRAGLGVDAENPTGAVALYERVGMHAVYRLDNWVKDV